MRLAALLLFVALVCHATPSAAQTFATVRVDGMPTLWVTDRTGQETKGKLLKWSDDEIVVQNASGPRTFALNDVALVERRDGLKNGLIIGASIGALGGLFAGGLADCPTGRSRCPGTRIAIALVNVGLYAAIGAGIDAIIPGRRKLWPGPPVQGGNVTVNIDPVRRGAFVGWRKAFHRRPGD